MLLIITALSFVKLLFLLRIIQEMGFLVYMVFYTARRLLPFLTFLLLFVCLFTGLNSVLRVDNDAEGTIYPGVNVELARYLDNYRSTVGAAIIPKYEHWFNSEESWRTYFGIGLVWFIWTAAGYFNQIIIKNFLINYVRVIFVRIYQQEQLHHYM